MKIGCRYEVGFSPIRVEVICVHRDGSEQRREILTIERRELAMETLSMSLTEGKALLAGVQGFVITQQVHQDLEQRRTCSACGERHTSKTLDIRP